MNGIIRAVIVVMILVAATPSPAEFVYTLDNQPHSTWKGGNSEKPFNWDVPGNWSDNTVPVVDTWRNVHFALDTATAIDYGSKYASDKDNGSFSIIVDAESAPLTITQSDVDLRWYASGRDGTARTSFVNLSPYHAVFNIKVIMYGFRNYDSGIHPGAEFNKPFEYTAGNPKFIFFAGDDEAEDDYVNTTIFRSTFSSGKPVSIEQGHIVRFEGTSASLSAAGNDVTVAGGLEVLGGNVTCATLQAVGDGEIKLENATLTVTSGLSGKMAFSGFVTIDHGSAAIDLSNASFDESVVLNLVGDGAVNYGDVTPPKSYDAFIKLNATGDPWGNQYFMNETVLWSSEKVAESGYDYIVDTRTTESTTLRTSGQIGDDVRFNGDSLTFIGSAGKEARFMHKCGVAEVTKLYMYACSKYELGGHNKWELAGVHKFKGDIVIGASSGYDAASAVQFYSGDANRWMQLDGKLSGSGAIRMYGKSDCPNLGFDFTDCDNSGYTGAMSVEGEAVTARFSAVAGLGDNPAVILAKGLSIAGGAKVEINNNVAAVVDQPNRGLYVVDSGTLTITSDLTWKGPVSFAASSAELTKTGDGSLILDGANGTASGTIKVSEGSLVAANPYAVGGIAVTGGTGTLYSLSEPSDGSRVIAEQPLLFIPGASVSADATENVASVVARGWVFSTANYGLKDSWKVVLTQVEVDGGVLVSAGAKKPGMAVVIR